jgi:acetyl-CoA carboxylase biotin carboxyl carrier protein
MRFARRFLLSKECLLPLKQKHSFFFAQIRPEQAAVASKVNSRPMAGLDSELVRHALQVARQHGFAEVEIALQEATFRAKLDPAPRRTSQGQSTPAGDTAPSTPDLLTIKAPLVGYYQERPESLAPGQTVRQGEVVAVIAALGLANDVESAVAGEVVDVLVSAGDPVEFGQVLATVRP